MFPQNTGLLFGFRSRDLQLHVILFTLTCFFQKFLLFNRSYQGNCIENGNSIPCIKDDQTLLTTNATLKRLLLQTTVVRTFD